jgi:hypothetical protein
MNTLTETVLRPAAKQPDHPVKQTIFGQAAKDVLDADPIRFRIRVGKKPAKGVYSIRQHFVRIDAEDPIGLRMRKSKVSRLGEVVVPRSADDFGAVRKGNFNRAVCRPGIDHNDFVGDRLHTVQAEWKKRFLISHNQLHA